MDRDAITVVPEAAPGAVSPHITGTGRPVAGGGRPASFRALRSTPFRLYFGGQIASASGTFLQQTAIGWLVLQVTGSATALGLVLAVGGVPGLVLGPWGGLLVDRVDLRRLLIGTQLVFGLLAAALWVAAAAGAASVPVLIALGVAGGLVSVVDAPARQAFVSTLVPADDLASAVSLNGVVFNTARVVGPAVAGVLIATVGTTPCFAINAVSYLVVVGALLAVHPVAAGRTGAGRGGGLGDALRYARTRQQLWLPLTMMALVGLLAFNFPVVLPVLASATLHGSGGTYGLLSTVLSVGSVAGSLAVGLVRHPRRVYLLGTALGFGVGLAGTAFADDLATVLVFLVITGAAGFAFVTTASTTLQLHSAPEYRGRIMALWVFVYMGTTPIGSIVAGRVTAAGGPRAALLLGAAACLLAAALAARVHTPPNVDALGDTPPAAA